MSDSWHAIDSLETSESDITLKGHHSHTLKLGQLDQLKKVDKRPLWPS